MRDGSYSLAFAANGQADEGHLQIRRRVLHGSTANYTISGELARSGDTLTARVLVIPASSTVPSLPFAADAPLRLTGRSDDGTFYLSGEGPGGVLVEIGGSWRSTFLEGVGDG